MDEIVSWVLSWGDWALVLAPTTLRDQVIHQLATAKRAYHSSNGKGQ